MKQDLKTFTGVVNKYQLTPELIRMYTEPRLVKFINDPPQNFIRALCGVMYSLDRKKNDTYLNLQEEIITKEDLQEQYMNAQWVQASVKISKKSVQRWYGLRQRYKTIASSSHLPFWVKVIGKKMKAVYVKFLE